MKVFTLRPDTVTLTERQLFSSALLQAGDQDVDLNDPVAHMQVRDLQSYDTYQLVLGV